MKRRQVEVRHVVGGVLLLVLCAALMYQHLSMRDLQARVLDLQIGADALDRARKLHSRQIADVYERTVKLQQLHDDK